MPEPHLVKTALARLTSPEIITEIVALLIAVLIAFISARLANAWQRRKGELGEHPSFAKRAAEGVALLTPFVAALAVMSIVRAVLAELSMHTAVIDTALELVTALVLVRLALFLL